MKKTLTILLASLALYAAPTQAAGLDSKMLADVQLGAGVGVIDFVGYHDSSAIYYLTAQKELNIILGDSDSFTQFRLGASSAAKTGAAEIQFDYITSALFKSRLQLQHDMAAYGVAGFSLAGISENAGSYVDLSFTYGFGMEWDITPKVKVSTEYVSYSKRAEAFAINAAYKF